MAKTLAAHRSGLLAYYDVMITSGPMEGVQSRRCRKFQPDFDGFRP
jgi:transposase